MRQQWRWCLRRAGHRRRLLGALSSAAVMINWLANLTECPLREQPSRLKAALSRPFDAHANETTRTPPHINPYPPPNVEGGMYRGRRQCC
jgi:hypothetical protein